MPATKGPTYAEFARAVAKFPREQLLRVVAEMAVEEARARLVDPHIEPPVTSFSLAGVARTALVVSRDAGSHHRERRRSRHVVGRDQVRRLCRSHLTIFDPALDAAGSVDLSAVLTRLAFEQFGGQYSPMENLSRAYALFVQYATEVDAMPPPAEWEQVLGTSFDAFMRTGFALQVAMLQNGGSISRDVLQMDHVRPIWEPLSPEELFDIVDRLFARSLDEHRAISRAAEKSGREKWSFNSLVTFPLIAAGNDLLCPSPQFLLDRVTATGLWYAGAKEWAGRFTDALGDVFEAYVGDQLRLMKSVQVLDQVRFTSKGSQASSCDWIVVTDEVVVLVEVKCARPTLDYRTGGEEGLADAAKKLGEAVSQLERTAKMIEDRDPAFAHIPGDRPVRGVIVTLEPFYLRQTRREHLVRSDLLAIAVASAHDLESSVTALIDQDDAGAQLLSALTPSDGLLPYLLDVRRGRTIMPKNPILDRAWDAWATWPVMDDA
jgi:hypothetical protein